MLASFLPLPEVVSQPEFKCLLNGFTRLYSAWLNSLFLFKLDFFGTCLNLWLEFIIQTFFHFHNNCLFFVLSHSIETSFQNVLIWLLLYLEWGQIGCHHILIVRTRLFPSLPEGAESIDSLPLDFCRSQTERVEGNPEQLSVGKSFGQYMQSNLLVDYLWEILPSFKGYC